jgi:Di-haem oxidoreductase, putative peroxidase
MRRQTVGLFCGFLLGIGFAVWWSQAPVLRAQLSERPGNTSQDPIDMPRDLSGLSIKNPRVRVVHTTDPIHEGGSMYLQQVDPWLGYMWGKSLFQRNFRERDGVYGDSGKIDGLLLPDGVTKQMDRSHVNSCGICHNNPYRDAGAGATIAKNGGTGRNTPHLFGTGYLEMIGLQMRQQILNLADTNHDGWISFEEMKKAPRCVIRNLPDGVDGEAVDIDLGSFDDLTGSGYPSLNAIIYVVFVDKNGQRIAFARNLNYPEVAGYTIEVQVYGWGTPNLTFRPPVSTTIRSFTATPFDIHQGLQPHDPTTYTPQSPNSLLAQVSNAGAQQFVTAVGKDRGTVRAPTKTGLPGISLDDPDRDGYCEEISEGDLDVTEWYQLNHPAPGRTKITADVLAGEKLFHKAGCAKCHVPDWHILGHDLKAPAHLRFDGDRRFFDLKAAWNDKTDRLEGKVELLADHVKGEPSRVSGRLSHDRWVPRRNAVTARGIYSDFKYHDVGEAFYQMQYDGSLVKLWKTAPLWGVGSTAPYGHDGASLNLDDVIRRHGGEALESRQAYMKSSDHEQKLLRCFLESLVLYQTDQLPCDINGDGKIDEHFMVQGMDTGLEVFNPEWLFRVPAKIEGPIRNLKGERITSMALTNLRLAYGLDLEYLKDTDGDGFPDVIDPEPLIRGFRDGVR